MRQWMSEDHEWTDKGPRKNPRPNCSDVQSAVCSRHCGRPPVTSSDERCECGGPIFRTTEAAYTPTELRLIIKRGDEDPRTLSPEERGRYAQGQIDADNYLAAIEKWAKDGFLSVPSGPRQ